MTTRDPSEDDRAERYRAPALDKGLDILEVLSREARGLTRAEIGRALGISTSQNYRMLERLVSRGYVCRLGGGDLYALTTKLFLLATGHPPFRRLAAQAQPLMDDFAARMRQSCHMVLPDAGCGVVVAQASPRENWEFRLRLGARLDFFDTGSGLTLLAFQRSERLAETLAIWGIGEAAGRVAGLEGQLAEIRDKGHRMAPSRQLIGVVDISVPILGPDGQAQAVLTCAFIEHPDDPAHTPATLVLSELHALATQLSTGAAFRD